MAIKMNTYSREYLRDLPAKRRREAISNAVINLQSEVIQSATCGNSFYIVDLSHFENTRNKGVRSYPPSYIPTKDDLIEGFRNKFPDCKVEYTEMWEDVRPGVRQQKKGILIDWS